MNRLLFLLLICAAITAKAQLPHSPLADSIDKTVWPRLRNELKAKNFKPESPIFIRVLKAEMKLEIWVWSGKNYSFFKDYNICYFSGGAGTKVRNGDGKSPEGFYTILPTQLNPVSHYHLAINIGYPNKMEQANGYTGDAIMINGHCASIGCYAMTDPFIDEIYTMVYHALAGGQKAISLHIFPFKMNDANMQQYAVSSYSGFWKNIKEGYDVFEKFHVPPKVNVAGKRYTFKAE